MSDSLVTDVTQPAPAPLSSTSSTLSSWAFFGMKVAVSGGLLWLLFSRIDVARFWTVARQSSLPWIGAALLAYAGAVAISAWRWYALLRVQGVPLRLTTVLGSFVVALFFNNFLPTNIGGDVMRVRDTAPAAGSNMRATTVVLADRIISLLGLALFAAIAATFSGEGRLPVSPWWIWAACLAGTAGSLIALFVPTAIQQALRPLTFLNTEWVNAQIEALTRSLANFRAEPFQLAQSLAVAVFVQAVNVAFYVAVASALGVRVGVWDMALIVPISALVQVLPVSINGFGVREAAFTVFFTRIGLPRESALLVSLEATALIMAFSLLGAAIYVARPQETRRRRADAR
jgi:glycosyltransferase 2 family protein